MPTPSDESITAVPPLRVIRPVEYVGAAMAVIAVGLIVGVFIGRARWLILIGVLLVPALLAAALLPGTVEWSAGSPNYRPATVEQVQESYELGLGRVVPDLTRLSAQELAEVGTIEVSIGAGEIVVALPFGVGTVVRATVGAGSIRTDVSFHRLHMPAPPAIQQAFEDCRSIGPGRRDCEALLFPDGLPYEESPWDEHRNMSGIGLSRSFEMGHPPFDLILDLRIGAGEIWVQQIGEIRVYELDWEG